MRKLVEVGRLDGVGGWVKWGGWVEWGGWVKWGGWWSEVWEVG